MADLVSNPEAFAAANAKADREYLESPTPEKAARVLEQLLDFGAEFRKSEGAPRCLEPPLPTCWPAVLIGREEKEVEVDPDADGS